MTSRRVTSRTTIFACAALLAVGSGAGADAASRHNAGGGVPNLDVQGSCREAQKFGADGNNKDGTFRGCMQDETAAHEQLANRWSSFKPTDRQSCVEQGRAPSPSYVEILTCLEMNTSAIIGGRNVPQIGGQLAPGLNAGTGTPAAAPNSGLGATPGASPKGGT